MVRTQEAGRRPDRTRQALLDAFRDALIADGYEHVTIRDLVERANVGRSTFYEHFESKEDLFRQSLGTMGTALVPFADTITPAHSNARLVAILEHFGSHREHFTGSIFTSAARPAIVEYWSLLFEERLQSSMVARYLAASQLAIIECWLTSEAPGSAEAIAAALHASTNALAATLGSAVSDS
jgi:AcrR family transcriptional regulator